MARSNGNGPEVSPVSDPVPVPVELVVNPESDKHAWSEAASRYNVLVDTSMQVWGNDKERLFTIPAMPGFANLPVGSRDLAFRSVYQTLAYRVAQTANGKSVQEAIEAAILRHELPGARSNNAEDSAIRAFISGLIEKSANYGGKLARSATDEQKAARVTLIDKTVAKHIAAGDRDKILALCKKAANTPIDTGKKQRVAKVVDTTGAAELEVDFNL